jgi:16S rRNA (guanine966-N2)-methyltransferase
MRMRIISGELKGRFIKVPDSKLIRPTTDRVRETLFNLISNRIDFDGIKVLDIYAGSGSLGLECISRGAAEVHFVEKNFVIYKNLEENIKSLDAEDKCTIFKMEAVKFSSMARDVKYDLILADPPFFKDDIYKVAENIFKNDMLENNGFFIIERSVQTRDKDEINLKVSPFKVIGDTCLYELTNS